MEKELYNSCPKAFLYTFFTINISLFLTNILLAFDRLIANNFDVFTVVTTLLIFVATGRISLLSGKAIIKRCS